MSRLPAALLIVVLATACVLHVSAAVADIPQLPRQPMGVPTAFFLSPPRPSSLLAGSAPATDHSPSKAPSSPLPSEPGAQCLQAGRVAGRAAGLPEYLMAGIARVESGRADGRGGVTPWPWSINAEGTDYVYDTKAEAIAAVVAMRANGVRSMDVGCMQVNLLHHPDAFASLDEAFDPQANARYAARFLTDLYNKTGSWQQATAWYHSANPELGTPYERKVEAAISEERRRGGTETVLAAGYGGAIPTAGAGAVQIAGSTGPVMLGNNAQTAHFLPAPAGTAGRGLDAYRSMPIPITGARFGHLPL